MAIRSTLASIRSASRRRWAARPSAPSAAHAGKAARRRVDRQVDRALAAAGDLGERRPVDRRDHLERLGAGHAPAADEVVGADGDAGDRAHVRELDQAEVEHADAAVDRDRGAVDVGGRGREQPGHQPGHLVGLAGARDRHVRVRPPVGALAVGAAHPGQLVHRAVGHVGADPARADGVGAHAARAEVDGDRLHQHDQAGLGRAVRGRVGRGPQAASDETATTQPPRCSRWGSAARAARKAPVRLVRSTASQPSGVWSTTLPECDDAGAVDQRVEAAQLLDGGADGRSAPAGSPQSPADRDAADLGRHLRAAAPAGGRSRPRRSRRRRAAGRRPRRCRCRRR